MPRELHSTLQDCKTDARVKVARLFHQQTCVIMVKFCVRFGRFGVMLRRLVGPALKGPSLLLEREIAGSLASQEKYKQNATSLQHDSIWCMNVHDTAQSS